MSLPYMNRLLDKVAMDILVSEYENLIEEFSLYNILQVMSIFLKGQYQRLELWSKFEIILSNILESNF